MTDDSVTDGVTRRDFIRTAATTAIVGSVATGVDRLVGAYAAGSDEIRIGLVGCGGRGTGAAGNAIESSQGLYVSSPWPMPSRIGSMRPARTWSKRTARRPTSRTITASVGLEWLYKQLLADA